MKMEAHVRERIVRNVLLSLVLYALPVLLLFTVLAVRGERPWEQAQPGAAAGRAERSR